MPCGTSSLAGLSFRVTKDDRPHACMRSAQDARVQPGKGAREQGSKGDKDGPAEAGPIARPGLNECILAATAGLKTSTPFCSQVAPKTSTPQPSMGATM